ncbi:MAG TPA: L,D-transpeptidase [Mycobacteriales bacterium]|nr:L,D-transpeptidase [Mycobacteriales bacterium]
MHVFAYGDRATGRPSAVVGVLSVALLFSLSTGLATVVLRKPAPAAPKAAPPAAVAEPATSTRLVGLGSPPTRSAAGACPAAPTLPAGDTLVLTARTPTVAVHATPGGSVERRLPSPTRDGQPLHLRVMETRGEWHRVQMPERPNSTTGWVRAAGMTTSRTPYRILIQRCSRRLTLFRAGRPVFVEPAAIGKSGTPTPLGDFYVDFVESWRPDSPYGPWLVSVTGFSEVYQTFGDGVGQIGIHGTQASTSVGRPTSNGCIRLQNAAVTRLAELVVAGTPVLIVD